MMHILKNELKGSNTKMKTSTKILITLIVWIAAIAITWGEMALILLVVKWIGVKFNFFKWSIYWSQWNWLWWWWI